MKNTSNNSNKNELEREKKKKVCDTIANHFIKKFNLIAALLFSVKPNENFCLNRLQRLYFLRTIIGFNEKFSLSRYSID